MDKTEQHSFEIWIHFNTISWMYELCVCVCSDRSSHESSYSTHSILKCENWLLNNDCVHYILMRADTDFFSLHFSNCSHFYSGHTQYMNITRFILFIFLSFCGCFCCLSFPFLSFFTFLFYKYTETIFNVLADCLLYWYTESARYIIHVVCLRARHKRI